MRKPTTYKERKKERKKKKKKKKKKKERVALELQFVVLNCCTVVHWQVIALNVTRFEKTDNF